MLPLPPSLFSPYNTSDMEPFKFDNKTLLETAVFNQALKKKKEKEKGEALSKEEEGEVLLTSFVAANFLDLF